MQLWFLLLEAKSVCHSLNQQASRRGHCAGQGADPATRKELGICCAVALRGLCVNPGVSLQCLLVPLARGADQWKVHHPMRTGPGRKDSGPVAVQFWKRITR